MAEAKLSYCAELVRRFDHDRYLTALFAPVEAREDLFALFAFNLELAKVAEVVSESLLGRMRLQWWREALAAAEAGQPPAHQVAGPLARAIARHGLEPTRFERVIDARETDLDREAPHSLAALERYAEATSAELVQLALEILGCRDSAASDAGQHVGTAWALTGLLRAVPFHARQKRLYLPADLSRQAGLRPGDLFELRSPPALHRVVEAVARRAGERLGEGRALRRAVPRRALPALLPAVLAEQALTVLRRARFDPFAPRVQRRSPGRAWRLAAARLRGRY